MATIPARVADRLAKGLKRFQPILQTAKTRDDGEADTVMIVTDILADVFGTTNIPKLRLNIVSGGRTVIWQRKLTGPWVP